MTVPESDLEEAKKPGRRWLTLTCQRCDFHSRTESLGGNESAIQMLARLDVAHDALNPNCPEVLRRAASTPTGETQ